MDCTSLRIIEIATVKKAAAVTSDVTNRTLFVVIRGLEQMSLLKHCFDDPISDTLNKYTVIQMSVLFTIYAYLHHIMSYFIADKRDLRVLMLL